MDAHLCNCDFSFLKPPKDVFNVSHSEYYIRHGEGKKAVRKIFSNGKYYDDEQAKLEEFKALIASENLTLPPDWTETDTFRYMYSGKLDLKKSLKTLKGHLEWRMSPERGFVGPKAQKLLEDGIMYISGRDKQYRPIIIVNAYRCDLKKNDMKDFTQTISFILDVAKKYYFVPGRVENWVIMIESNGAGVFDFPTKLIKAINDVTAGNYSSTLDKLYIMNPSTFIKKSWNLIQGLVDPETATKIAMLNKEEFSQLLERIPSDQLEQCYGGTLPARRVYWPPVNTLDPTLYAEDTASTSQASQRTTSDKAAEKESPPAINEVQKSRTDVDNSAKGILNSVDVNKEEQPKAKSLLEVEEWSYKGRVNIENENKQVMATSVKLDGSDEQVEVGEIKELPTHVHPFHIKPVSSQRSQLKARACGGENSEPCGGGIVLEKNEPANVICGSFCSAGRSRDDNVANGCNIF